MRLFITTLLSLLYTFCLSQNCDTIKISQLSEEARKIKNKDFKKALQLAKQAISLSSYCPDSKHHFTSVIALSAVYLSNDYADSVILLLKGPSADLKKNISPFQRAKMFHLLSSAYIKTSELKPALEASVSSLNYFEKAGDSVNIAKVLINMSNIYQQLNNFKEAESRLKSAEKILLRLKNNEQPLGELYNTIGILYGEFNNIDSSEKYLLRSTAIREKLNDIGNLGWNYNNLGGIYSIGNQPEKSIFYLEKAFKYFDTVENFTGLASVANNLGSLYNTKSDFKKALYYFSYSRILYQKTNNPDNLESLFLNLSDLYQSTGDYKTAVLYADSLIALRDTTYGKRLDERIAEMQTKYDTEKKEAQLKLSALEIEKQKEKSFYTTLAFIIIIIVLVLISLLFYFNYQAKQKKKFDEEMHKQNALRYTAVIETLEKERNRIAAELHDNTGALVSFIVSKIDWALANDSKKEDLRLIKNSAQEVMTSLRETLWTLNNKTITSLDLIDKLKLYIKKHVLVECKISEEASTEVILPNDVVLSLYRCVQEIINNINKHSKATRVSVRFITNETIRFGVMISDNGIGFEGEHKEDNYGIRNLKSRMNTIGAKLSIDSKLNEGTKIEIFYN